MLIMFCQKTNCMVLFSSIGQVAVRMGPPDDGPEDGGKSGTGCKDVPFRNHVDGEEGPGGEPGARNGRLSRLPNRMKRKGIPPSRPVMANTAP